MNILHVGSGNLYGGVEKVLLTLARHARLCPALEQSFAVCFPGLLEDELSQAGAAVYRLRPMRGRNPLAIAANRYEMTRLERKFDAVLYHSLWTYDLLGVGRRRDLSARVLWAHDAVGGLGLIERVAKLQVPDLILSNSRFTAQSLSALFPNAEPRVISCPVEFTSPSPDPERRKSIRDSLETSADSVVIVQCSRMEAWKGQGLHLKAVAELQDLQNWTLWIAGGAQRPEEQEFLADLQRQAAALGISRRVRFLGQRADVPDLLAAADIYCQPNLGPEPFGIAYVEAMMARLPIVACRLGAAAELIDASCGFLCDSGDERQLASILRLLICDQNLRQRLSRNGPERAKRISDPGARVRDLYEALRLSVAARNTSEAPVIKLAISPKG